MTAYDQAHAAHQDAVKRRDTRAQHQTEADLKRAMTERLRRERRLIPRVVRRVRGWL